MPSQLTTIESTQRSKQSPKQWASTSEDGLLTIHTDISITQQDLDHVSGLLNASGWSAKVLFDLSQTNYIDSAGIGWLLNCHKRFREAGGTLIIHSVAPMVLQVIRLMRLDTVFKLANDVRTARRLAEVA